MQRYRPGPPGDDRERAAGEAVDARRHATEADRSWGRPRLPPVGGPGVVNRAALAATGSNPAAGAATSASTNARPAESETAIALIRKIFTVRWVRFLFMRWILPGQ